jgi:hypothetical protein
MVRTPERVGRAVDLIVGGGRIARHVHLQRLGIGRALRHILRQHENVAPGRSVSACLNAFRIISGVASRSVIMSPHFVTGRYSATRSTTWCDSL